MDVGGESAHWYMYIITSQRTYYSFSVDQNSYATSVGSKYLDTTTIKENSKWCKTNFPHDMVFTKEDTFIRDEQVKAIFRYYNIHWRADLDGKPLGTAHDNPILDTRQYIVQFKDGDEAELAANVIATNMYAQCDPDGNQYILLDSLIDFRRSTTALCYDDQKITTAALGNVIYLVAVQP